MTDLSKDSPGVQGLAQLGRNAIERVAKMGNENWTATDCGKYIRVCAPNGGICEMWGDSDDAHQRFAYFVLRQMIRDLAAVTEDLGLVTPPPVFEVTKAMCAKAARANVDASLATAPDEILESATAIEALAWLFKWQQVRELHKHRRAA